MSNESKLKQNNIEILTSSDSQIVTNKDIDGGTASNTNRITIPKNSTINLDALNRKEATLVYDTTTQSLKIDNGTSLDPIGGSSSWGAITGTLSDQTDLQNELNLKSNLNEVNLNNLIKGNNSTAESSIGNWATYSDAAGTMPVDGTGGTANITFTRTTTPGEILNGSASFKLSKDAANRQGQGASLDVSVDEGLRGKSLNLAFNSKTTSNYSYVNNDLRVFVYDVTNSALLGLDLNNLDPTGRFSSNIQIPSNTLALRIIFHVATTSALAYDLIFDNVELQIKSSIYIPSISDFQDYIPTTEGLGSVTINTARYKQIGDEFLFEYKITVGVTTANQARIYLPPGYSISNSYSAGYHNMGDIAGNFPAAGGVFFIAQPGDTSFSIGTSIGTQGLTPQNGDAILNSGLVISGKVRAKINSLTSGFSSVASVAQNLPVEFAAIKNGGSSTAGNPIASWTTINDPRGAFNNTTGVYTILDSGWYDVKGATLITSAAADYPQISTNLGIVKLGPNYSATIKEVSWSGYLNAGQTLSLSYSANASYQAADTGTRFSISKTNTSNALMNIRKIAYIRDVKANNTGGQSLPGGSWTTRELNTVEDSYGIISSLSSNQFTLQPGTYRIRAVSTTFGAANSLKCRIYNVTGSTTVKESLSGNSNGNNSTFNDVSFVITITAATTFSLDQYSGANVTGGYPANVGDSEKYSFIEIEKTA